MSDIYDQDDYMGPSESETGNIGLDAMDERVQDTVGEHLMQKKRQKISSVVYSNSYSASEEHSKGK